MYTNYQIFDEDFNAKEWIDKYPFLRIKDASCTYYEENTDEVCWLNDIPLGWVKGFGKEMCDELLEALGEYVNDFIIIQMKEKFAMIRIYWRWDDKDDSDAVCEELNRLTSAVENIISKYAAISRQTCYICGTQDASMIYDAWVLPMCMECRNK
jgi:hypothetical protein